MVNSSMLHLDKQIALSSDSTPKGRLEGAIEIWKKNRSTLGLFPKGAFEDHAAKGFIVYLLKEDIVIGYLLYRMAKGRAVIVHLCVDEKFRGVGGAKRLFGFFRSEIEDGYCRGIEVKCRADYEIAPLWPGLGFEWVSSGSGRGKRKTELVKWFFHFDVPDFFYEMIPQPDDDDLIWTVLDSNIVFKLAEPEYDENQEACSLMAETISPYARYLVTPEIHAEIERQKSIDQKAVSRENANQFECLDVKRSEIDKYRKLLTPLWKTLKEARDKSDLMHIVYAAAAGAPVFITQDGALLSMADEIEEACGLRVIRPVQFISELDALENSGKYQPVAIARTEYAIRCPNADEAKDLAQSFACIAKGEKRKQLEAKIRVAIAATESLSVSLVEDGCGDHIALLAEKHLDQQKGITLLRHNGSKLAVALLQNILWKRISSATQFKTSILRIEDPFAAEGTFELFSQRGFFDIPAGVARASIKGLMTRKDTLKETEKAIQSFLAEDDHTGKQILRLSTEQPRRIEEALWPVKICDADIPTFLVPIQPYWAMNLFDEELASRELMGADPARFFNWENVYYRSARKVSFTPGCRILWYVSTEKKAKVMQIRACSRLLNFETSSAKALFSRYRRLGIYEWRNLMELTDQDPHGELMALRFYQTECFLSPIALEEFSKFGINGAPQGPRKLTEEQFNMIYSKGMHLDVQ